MINLSRGQRWVEWRNADTTACPAFGCVELFSYEVIGTRVVLLGRSAQCFVEGYTARQGAFWNHVFNDSCSVQPDKIGRCTFDQPTWARCTGTSNTPSGFGEFALFGIYPSNSLESPGGLVTLGGPWELALLSPGQVDLSINPENGGGWNTFAKHPILDDVWLVGGMRTFLFRANSPFRYEF